MRSQSTTDPGLRLRNAQTDPASTGPRPRSPRIPQQLALSYLGIVILCLGLTAWSVLTFVRAQTIHRLVEEMTQESTFLATLLARNGWPPEPSGSERRVLAEAVIRHSLDCVVVMDSHGVLVLDSLLLRRPSWIDRGTESTRHAIEAALRGKPMWEVRRVPPVDPTPAEAPVIDILFTAVPITVQGKIVGALAMRRPLADMNLFLHALARAFIWFGIGISAAACLLGALLSRVITRPIQQHSAAASRIADGHLDERIEVRGARELEALGDSFNRMAAALEEQQRARAQFIADASHELKTPLTSLKALLEALDRGASADPQLSARFMSLLRGEVGRLELLVRDLLDLHRGADLHVERVDFERLLRDVADQVAPALPSGCVSVEVPAGLHADADAARLRQVLLNLVDNAARAVRGRDDARIVLRASAADGTTLVQVQDNGPGIPPAERERVFERFYRLDEARARKDGGTGLGLAIARSIVEAHGGRIWIEDGEGARFAFTLAL